MYLALKKMEVKRGEQYITVYPGELVPEAESWPNKENYVNWKHIKEIPDAEAVKYAKVAVVAEAEEELESEAPAKRTRGPGKKKH